MRFRKMVKMWLPCHSRRPIGCSSTPIFPIDVFLFIMATSIFLATSASMQKEVKIGALFLGNKTGGGATLDPLEDQVEKAFLHAVDRVNSIWSILPKLKLVAIPDRIVPGDSFHASKKVCNMVKQGVVGIFGPSMPPMADHVQSLCKKLKIPHIETRWDFPKQRSQMSPNLYPHPASLSYAVFDLIKHWQWKSFAIIYDDPQGLVRLQELFKNEYDRYKPEIKIFVRHLKDSKDFRPVLKEVKINRESRIIIDCHADKIANIFSQAQQLGMMTLYHSYLVTSLDFHTLDLHKFQHSTTNITGFRIVNPNGTIKSSYVLEQIFSRITSGQVQGISLPLYTNAALMFDAVVMFAQALTNSSEHALSVQSASCDPGSSWDYGTEIIKLIMNNKMYGLTGLIEFNNTDGFRKEFNLELVLLRTEGFRMIGSWNMATGIHEIADQVNEEVKKHVLRVVTKISEPYVINKNNTEKIECDKEYCGYCIDLLDKISEIIHYNYTIQIVSDNTFGKFNKTTNEWNGVMKELIDHKGDIGIGDLSITQERERDVDFTMPFMNLGISIMYKKPTKKDPILFSFLQPFSIDVWMYMITAYLGVSTLLFLLARISPMEWMSSHPCEAEPDELENQFTLPNCMWFAIGSLMQQGCDFLPKFNPYDWEHPHPCDPTDELENKFSLMNSMWFTIGSLMQQGSDLAPKAISTRLVAGIWWFFTLIMISSYTASLAAFLTSERMVPAINNVEDLAGQTKIKYGCLKDGTTDNFFRDSPLPIYQKMYAAMRQDPSVYTNDNSPGVDKVRKGGYAYIIESTANEYFIFKSCDLVQIGGLLDSKSYGIAIPDGSEFRAPLNDAVLKLQKDGELGKLKEKWWKKKECPDDKSSSATASELDLANVGGVFVVLLAGLGIACAIGIIEFVWKTRKAIQQERGNLYEEFLRELKFALSCKGDSNSKPVPKKSDEDNTTRMSVPLANFS